MNIKTLMAFAFLLMLFTAVAGQQLQPLETGSYKFFKVRYDDDHYSPNTSEPVEISKSETDLVKLKFPVRNGHMTFERIKGNVFASPDFGGDRFDDNPQEVMVLRAGGVMEIYRLSRKYKKGCLLLGKSGADFKSARKQAKENMENFDVDALYADIAAANAVYADQKKADAAAKAAAAQQARLDADICTPLLRLASLAPSNFNGLQGEKDAYFTEEEGEPVYASTELLPLFWKTLIVPGYTDDSKRISGRTGGFASKMEAQTELAFIAKKVTACLSAEGYEHELDSGIHNFKKGNVRIALGDKSDFDSDGDTYYIVYLTVYAR